MFIETLHRMIIDNMAMENLSVKFIADRMCMSESTLFRHVKSVLGIGVNEYIRNIRLENVVFLLTNETGGVNRWQLAMLYMQVALQVSPLSPKPSRKDMACRRANTF